MTFVCYAAAEFLHTCVQCWWLTELSTSAQCMSLSLFSDIARYFVRVCKKHQYSWARWCYTVTVSTYLNIFSTICGALNSDCINTPKLRVQDYIANRFRWGDCTGECTAFPGSKQLYCMLPCKDNVRQHLTTIGVTKSPSDGISTQ